MLPGRHDQDAWCDARFTNQRFPSTRSSAWGQLCDREQLHRPTNLQSLCWRKMYLIMYKGRTLVSSTRRAGPGISRIWGMQCRGIGSECVGMVWFRIDRSKEEEDVVAWMATMPHPFLGIKVTRFQIFVNVFVGHVGIGLTVLVVRVGILRLPKVPRRGARIRGGLWRRVAAVETGVLWGPHDGRRGAVGGRYSCNGRWSEAVTPRGGGCC